MFRFHCLKVKKPSNNENASDSSAADNSVSPENAVERRNEGEAQLNIFTIAKDGNNLFFRCFKGMTKCASDSYSPHGAYLNRRNNEVTVPQDTTERELPPINSANLNKKSLAEKLFDLSKNGWYWGPLSHTEANEKLQGEADGAFLVRDSSHDQHVLTLSFRSHQETMHTHIRHIGATFSLESKYYFDTMEDLITYSMSNFLVARRNPHDNTDLLYIKLTQPISRFTQVRPLQYLCRFVIRQYVRADMRQKLPLPQSIMEYIEEAQF